MTEADTTVNELSYDNNGNLLETKRGGQVQQSYEYDPRNQLRKVLGVGNAEVARFDYDAERRRVEKTAYGTQPERYVYAGDKIVSEYRGASGYETNLAKYQIGADETIRGEFFNQAEGAKYYFSDALGSTTALAGQVSSNWTATNSYSYDAWGKASSNQQSNNSIGYTGQRLDTETGLMALGNGERYYSPTLARFIQQDSFTGVPSIPASLNRYSYAHNSPLINTDQNGNAIPLVIWAVVAAVVAISGSRATKGYSDAELHRQETGKGSTLESIGYAAQYTTGQPQFQGAITGKDYLSGRDLTTRERVAGLTYGEDPINTARNFGRFSAAAGRGAGNAAYGTVTGIPMLAYGLATDFNGTVSGMYYGLAEKTGQTVDFLADPMGTLERVGEDGAIDAIGEFTGAAAFEIATAKFGLGTLGKTRVGKATANVLQESRTALKSKAGNLWNKFNSDQRGSLQLRREKPRTRFIVGEEGRTVDLQSVANPNDINFTQRTVSGNVEDYARDMKNGDWDWTRKDSGPIRVMEVNGKLVSYDNRRLMAARQAGLKEIPIIRVDPNDIMPGSKSTWGSKFRSRRFKDLNIRAGGVVPEEGLSDLPKIVMKGK